MIDDTNNPTINTTTPQEPPPTKPVSDVVETILKNSSTVVTNPPTTEALPHPSMGSDDIKPKRKNPVGMLIGLVLFLGALSVGAYYISQQGNLADNRSSARELDCRDEGCSSGYSCKKSGTSYSCVKNSSGGGGGNTCNAENCDEALGMYCNDRGRCVKERYNPTCVPACSNGYTCKGTTCVANTDTVKCGRNNDTGAPVCCTQDCPPANRVCEGKNRLECKTGNIHCTIDVNGCKEKKPEDKPLATPTPSPICTNIKVYKGTAQVTPSTLLPGDTVTIAVVGTGSPSQARFRINGAQIVGDTDADPNWTISTTKNASQEYTVTYTIPTGVTTFLFEAETFAQGAWR